MTASPQSWPDLGKTAIGVAALRAVESRRPDRLFDDFYARAFVEAGRALVPDLADAGQDDHRPLTGLGALFYAHVVVRTRFYDDYLLAATASGCSQVVLLAAGLDTRAFRLCWPNPVRLFELDLPAVLDFKQRVLANQGATPSCARVAVPADLREDWSGELLAAGFQRAAPTAWLAEGLLVYLSYDEATRMLTTVNSLSASGSHLSFEHSSRDDRAGLLARARAMPEASQLTSLWKGGLGEHAPQWLADHGWRSEIHSRRTLAARYGRPSDDPPSGGYLTAQRD
ncbi:MAG: class I SAM-dependent methyltransferase [Pseudonocardiaceae bacterium]